MTDKKHPSPEEIQREFEDFVRQRFGGSVQVMTNVGEVPPPAQKTIETAPPPAQEKVLPEDFAFTPKEVKAHLDSTL